MRQAGRCVCGAEKFYEKRDLNEISCKLEK